MAKTKLTREQKAQALYVDGVRPLLIGPNEWSVPGSNGTSYEVREETDGTYTCSCPDALYRSHDGELCKHVLLVRLCADLESQAVEHVEQHKCQACARASNLNAPYLWCGRDKSHYAHERAACGSFTGRVVVVC
jgi:hypothetical protein